MIFDFACSRQPILMENLIYPLFYTLTWLSVVVTYQNSKVYAPATKDDHHGQMYFQEHSSQPAGAIAGVILTFTVGHAAMVCVSRKLEGRPILMGKTEFFHEYSGPLPTKAQLGVLFDT